METSPEQSKSPPADEKIEKLKVILNNPENTYYSGQTIRGTISLNCGQKTKIRGIYFRVVGKSKCGWTEFLIRESKAADGKETMDARYWGKEEHLNPAVYIIGSKNGSFTLCKGTTTYNFSFELKTDLPSTFSGDYGKIKYIMEFVVDKPWFNEKYKCDLTIVRTLNLNYIPDTRKLFENQLTKNYGLLDAAPISLHVKVPKRGFLLGESIPITTTVTNSSKMHVDKVKFHLIQIIEYHSMEPSKRIRTDSKRLVKKDADGVCKKTEQKYDIVIDVPLNIPPTQDATTSRLIHISYELEIEVKMSKFHKNLVSKCPITIGTVPLISNDDSSQSAFRMSLGQPTSEADLTHMFSNWSLDLNASQCQTSNPQSNRSSVQAPYPISPVQYPVSSTPYPVLPCMPTPSIASSINNWSVSSRNSLPAVSNYSPTAPPIEYNMNNSSAQVRPNSLFIPRPPSYDEVCRFSNQINNIDFTNLPSMHHKS